MHFVLSFAILFAASVEAAVGPIAELVVSNAQRSPDGFKREYVIHVFCEGRCSIADAHAARSW